MSISHLSYSSIDKFRKCPRSWYWHYVEKVSRTIPYWLFSGNCVHSALAFNYEQKIKTRKNLPEEEVVQKFIDEFKTLDPNRGRPQYSASASSSGIEFFSRDPGLIQDINVAVLETYQRTLAQITQPVVAEFSWRRKVAGVDLVGRLDLIDNKGTVIDFKVSGKMPRKDSWHKSLQPTVYAVAMGGPIKFQYQYLIKLATPTVKVFPTERTAEDIDHFVNGILPPIIACINAGIFPYAAEEWSWLCSKKYCDYYGVCKEGK